MAQRSLDYLVGKLLSEVPQLPPPLAQHYLSNAWTAIQEEREWSFRHKDGIIFFPSLLTTGTISLTQYSTTCILDATALAAWVALGAQPPLPTLRQLRFPSKSERIYNIVSFDSGAGEIVLDKMYTGTTNASSTYKLYSAYITPYRMTGSPDPYFSRFRSMRSLDYGWTMLDSRNTVRRERLDLHDPGRIQVGQPLCYTYSHDRSTTIGDDTTVYRFYEFWPHVQSAVQFETRYIQRAISFEEDPDQLLPEIISPRLVILRALVDAYRWAESHANTHPELQRKNWQYLRAQLASKYPTDMDTYTELLRKAIQQDNNLHNQELLHDSMLYRQNLVAVPQTLLVTA